MEILHLVDDSISFYDSFNLNNVQNDSWNFWFLVFGLRRLFLLDRVDRVRVIFCIDRIRVIFCIVLSYWTQF